MQHSGTKSEDTSNMPANLCLNATEHKSRVHAHATFHSTAHLAREGSECACTCLVCHMQNTNKQEEIEAMSLQSLVWGHCCHFAAACGCLMWFRSPPTSCCPTYFYHTPSRQSLGTSHTSHSAGSAMSQEIKRIVCHDVRPHHRTHLL